MRPSSPAASPVLLVVMDGNELLVGDTVTLALEDEDDDDADDDNEVEGNEVKDLLVVKESESPNDRLNERIGFTNIHLGVASDAASRIKQAVDVKKQVKVKIRRDFCILLDGLYSDIT